MSAMFDSLTQIHQQGALGLVHDLFLHSAELITQTGRIYGRDAIAQAWTAELATLSQQQVTTSLTAADEAGVGWAADLSARHVGDGFLGLGRGQAVTLRTIAVYRRLNGRITRGWRVLDTVHLVRQLGVSQEAIAARLADQMLAAGFVGWRLGEVRPGLGQLAPPLSDPTPTGIKKPRDLAVALDYVWNHRRLDLLNSYYVPRAELGWSDGRVLAGAADVRQAILSILAAIPDATLIIEFVAGNAGQMAAVWRLIGHHTGNGFGLAPTGVRVKVLGASVYRLQAGRIVKERTLIDEIGIQAQILATLQRSDLGRFTV